MNNILKCATSGLTAGLFRVPHIFMWVLFFTFAGICNVQAAPAWQATGTAATGTGAVSPAWPAHAINDIALLFVESAGGEPVTLSTAAGFAAVANSPQATGAGTAGTRISVFWARATSAAMATPTVADPGNHVYARIITYRGVANTGNPWDVTGGGVKAAASTAVTVTGVTTTQPDTLIVQAVSRDDDANGAEFSAETNADLTGITERSDAGTTSSNGGGFAVWDGARATTGAIGDTTAAVSVSTVNAFMTIALRPGVPAVTTNAASALTATGATLNGTVSSNGASTTVTFDYGLTVGYGTTVAATPSPLAAGASGTAVSAVLTGLACNTTYHFRVNGQNSAGTTNGGDATFTTTACLPSVTTNAATAVLSTGATLNGTVSSNGAITTVMFDYGPTAAYGSTATASASPLAAGASGTAVSAVVTGLTCGGTTYHFRVRAVNSAGTANGSDATFTTAACGVTLGKTAGASAGVVGSNVTFNLIASNPSAAALTNVVLTDVIPTGMTYITSAPTLGTTTLAGQTLTWTIPYLPAGGSAQLTLVVQPTARGSFTNTVQSPGAADASATILILPSAITRYSMDEAVGSWTGAAGEVIDSGGTNLPGHRQTTTTPTTTNTVSPNPTIAASALLQAPPVTVVGGFCNAGRFDGNAVVVSATGDYFHFGQTLSASAWIYPTAYPSGGSDLYSILSNDTNYEFHLNPAGHLYWWWNYATLTTAATIPLNTWTHIAITMDSSLGTNSRQRIYINGVADTNTNNWSGTLDTNYCPFYIGGDITTGAACALIPARNFHGMIDEAKIYNYELNAAEVNADMTLGRLCGASTFDHVRIEHDGTASTCTPKTVTIKACMDASCSSLYTAQPVTVHLSPAGWAPSDVITINGGVTTATLSNTSISSPSLTLGTTSVNPAPANNTRCFNGATETCTLSVGSTACTFDAAEPGANPQSHLYTKLAGTAFNIDILAVGSPATTVDTTKNSTVSVDLVDTSSTACTGTSTALNTAQSVTLISGRRTVSMTCATIAPSAQVRIRIGAAAPYSYACSYDKLAVRPSAVTLTSSNTLAAPPSPTDANTIRAGAAFNIGATTTPSAYTGTLTLDSTYLTAQLPSNGITQQSGGVVGTLAVSPALVANTAQGNNATYGEVGYLYANAGTFRDTGFTSVDQLAQLSGCAATDTCDCLLSTHVTNGSVPDNVSTVLVNGRYGCYVGNNTTYAFGRFIPDHLETAISAVGGVPMTCPAASGLACPTSGFVYSGQAFTTQVTARNLAGGTTQNYYSNFAKDVALTAWNAMGSTGAANQNPGPGVLSVPTPLAAADFVAGVGVRKVSGNPAPYVTYTFNSSPIVPTNIYLRAVDADNVSSRIAAAPGTSIEGGVQVVSGRMKISNAYGSELLPLPVTAAVQYYNTAGSWLTSATDNVTSFNPATNLVPTIVKGPLVAGNVSVNNVGTVVVAGGVRTFRLNRPGVSGSADLNLNVPGYLLAGSNGAAVNPSVPGRVTFGVYKAQEIIYMRETY